MNKLKHRKQDDKYFEKLKISPDFIGDNPDEMKEGTICPEEIIPLKEEEIKCVKANILNVKAKKYFPVEKVEKTFKDLEEELKDNCLFCGTKIIRGNHNKSQLCTNCYNRVRHSPLKIKSLLFKKIEKAFKKFGGFE